MANQELIVYEPTKSGHLHQGEILTNVLVSQLDPTALSSTTDPIINFIIHPYAVILSQECDLYWDFKGRSDSKYASKKLPNILFCEVITAEELRSRNDLKSDIWRRICDNKDERYQFLQKVQPVQEVKEEGLPELGIDFKRYFTLSTDEVYKRVEIGDTKRRCRLVPPYAEHLSSRFSQYLSRIALPMDHQREV